MGFNKLVMWFLLWSGIGEWVWRQMDIRKRAEVKKMMREIFGEDAAWDRADGFSDAEAKSSPD